MSRDPFAVTRPARRRCRRYSRAVTNGESSGEPSAGAAARRRGLRTGRLEAFSDGVFAIAVTLLVLEIKVPSGAATANDLLAALIRLWPSYLAYVVSFSTIGAIWLGHNAITEYLDRVDSVFVRLNLLLLLLVSFVPLPTRLFADYIGHDAPERVAATCFGANLLFATAVLRLLWAYAVRERLVRPDAADEEIQLLTKRLIPGLVAYLILIVTGLFFPVVAVGGYLAIAAYFIIPVRHRAIVRLRRRRQPGGGTPGVR
jgi:uncharacterized membrane protein